MKKFKVFFLLFIIFNYIYAEDLFVYNKVYSKYKIEVLVQNCIMNFYGIDEYSKEILIASYIVATPKTTEVYPKEVGKILSVDLNPWWYPTERTKNEFLKKGIYLPDAVSPGDKNNYMGEFKIILSNYTKERGNVYRIHGNLDESSIGKRSSGGCIRMKNSEGKQFAIFVKEILEKGSEISVIYI